MYGSYKFWVIFLIPNILICAVCIHLCVCSEMLGGGLGTFPSVYISADPSELSKSPVWTCFQADTMSAFGAK